MIKIINIIIGFLMLSALPFGRADKLENTIIFNSSVDELDHYTGNVIENEKTLFQFNFTKQNETSTFLSQKPNSSFSKHTHEPKINGPWSEKNETQGLGKAFTVRFNISNDDDELVEAYYHHRIIEIFNTCYRSKRHWTDSSKTQSLRMYFPDIPSC